MSAALVPTQGEPVRHQTDIESTCQNSLLNVLAKNKKTIDAVVGQIMDPKRFAYLAVMAIRQTPALAGCSPFSFLNAVMLASQMGLEIRRDSAYLIPFGKECQLLIDYKGKLTLARRGGNVGGIQAVTVRERDDFQWSYTANGVSFHHEPKFFKGDRGNIVGVYAFAQINGATAPQFCEPMNLADIDKIRRRSRAGVKSMSLQEIFKAGEINADGQQEWQSWGFRDPRRQPWVTDFEAMAWKTTLHRLCKSLPLDPIGQLSQEVDEGFETGRQPNILGDAIEIDPADDKPMIEAAATHEEFQQKRAQIVAAKTAPKANGSKEKENLLAQIAAHYEDDGYHKVLSANGREHSELTTLTVDQLRVILTELEAVAA